MGYEVRKDRLYTKSHEWIKVEGNVGTVGITQYAVEHLGELVNIDLPEVGKEVQKGEEVAVLDSIKASEAVYSPVSGKIIEVNEALSEDLSLLSDSPYDEGWIFKIEIKDPSELDQLLKPEEYEKTLEE